MSRPLTLVSFAVKEEARYFYHVPRILCPCESLITGMGRKNAEDSIRKALSTARPKMVVTAGFAGGLNPKLKIGTVVFEEDNEAGLTPKLLEAQAIQVRFHCAERVAVTAAEKQALWRSTGADVVEMESEVIRTICREQRIPAATVRVISDPAGDDLPLDFNALMTSDCRINYARLAWKIISAPQKIPKLLKFQEQTVFAARRLAEALRQSLSIR